MQSRLQVSGIIAMYKRALSILVSFPLALAFLAVPAHGATPQQGALSANFSSASTKISYVSSGISSKKKETAGQRNAKKKAKSYLSWSSFSRKGLIDQLKYEGFSAKDAKYGVDALKVNWKKQAVKKAKSYLSWGSFSESSLYDQLIFEGFTPSQAKYGVKKAYK